MLIIDEDEVYEFVVVRVRMMIFSNGLESVLMCVVVLRL